MMKTKSIRIKYQILAYAVPLLLTMSVSAEIVLDFPRSENTIAGSRAGSMADVNSSNNLYEGLSEQASEVIDDATSFLLTEQVPDTDNTSNGRSYLEHEWIIGLSVDAISSTFFVEAYHSANQEGDNFLFSFAADGINFTDMLTVSNSGDDNSLKTFMLPTGLSGSVTIKVTDTDNTPGNNNVDTLYVDSMYIKSDGVPTNIVQDHPRSENTIAGSRAGSMGDVNSSNNVYEGLSEQKSEVTDDATSFLLTGPVPDPDNASNARSYLEHEWIIDLSVNAINSTFFVEAHHSAKGDNFVFSFAADGNNFTDMLTVSNSSDDNSLKTFTLPTGLSGSVTIKVTDTDNTPGNSSIDTLYIDSMYIESSGIPSGGGDIEALAPMSYQTSTMDTTLTMNGAQPTDPGTYPVFLWFAGTNVSAWSADDEIITNLMAERGFVAVAVDYDTRGSYPGSCAALSESVQEVFDSSVTGSAINAISSLPKADPSKGIVVAGFSQGGNVASLAKDYNYDVQAAYVIGHGYNDGWGADCYKNSDTTLPSDRIRSVMGENDGAWVNYSADDQRGMLEATTGYSCGSQAMSCTQTNGSGWWLVTNSQTADSVDDH
jgi:general stress protein CsbA